MLTDGEIESFINRALSKAGSAEMVTPREIIRDYLTLLNILRDNAGATFEDLMKNVSFSPAEDAAEQTAPVNDTAPAVREPSRPISEVNISTTNKNKISLFDIDI